MAYKNRFHKVTLGVDADVFVTKGVEYTNDATFKDFVANAVEGEVGIFKTSDYSAYDGLAAAAAGTEVFFALKRDGAVEKSLPFTIGTATITKQAYVAPVKHVVTVTSIAAPTAPVKGDYLELSIIETTPGMQPLPTSNYGVEAKTGESWVDVLTRLVALINSTTSVDNQDRTLIATASIAADDITLTAKNYNEHFVVALRGLLADNATAAVTTQFKVGSGTPDQATEAEKAGDIRKGVTTNYPGNDALPEEFGKATSFVSAADQFEVVVIKHFQKDVARTLEQNMTRKSYTFLYLNSNAAANPSAEVNTILGV